VQKKLFVLLTVVFLTLSVFSCKTESADTPPKTVTVAKPAANPADGHEFDHPGGEVTLTSSTKDAEIWYTTGSGQPNTLYSNPVQITAAATIKAVARKSGMQDSEMLTVSYTVKASGAEDPDKAKKPEADPESGHVFMYPGGSVVLTTEEEDAAIWYTKGAGEPDTLYDGHYVGINENTTIKAVTKKEGMADSEILTALYSVKLHTPAADHEDGHEFVYPGGTVTLSTPDSTAAIYYTTGQGEPNTPYTVPINITAAATIKAVAKKANLTDSEILTASYTVAVQGAAAKPYANFEDGHVFTESGTITFQCDTPGAEIYYSTAAGGAINTAYTEPVTISVNTNFRVQARGQEIINSEIFNVSYRVRPALPEAVPGDDYTFEFPGGTVALSCTTQGAAIYYTTMETGNPNILYSTPINVTAATTIRAHTRKTSNDNSDIVSFSYSVAAQGAVAAPSPSPASGHVFAPGGGTVTLTSATNGATIWYTFGSGAPDTIYAGPISITETRTIRANAVKTGSDPSEIITAHYTVELAKVENPVFSPAAATHFNPGGGFVTITSATENAQILYTLGSGTPNTIYTGPIEITNVNLPTVIRAYARRTGWLDSDTVTSPTFTVERSTVAVITADPASGHHFTTDLGYVTLTTSTPSAEIRYTFEATGEPNILYTGPIKLELTTMITIRAIATRANWNDSPPFTANYTMEPPAAMEFAKRMKVGWNLGNTLDAHNNGTPNETAWGNPQATQALFNAVAAKGFGAVRIPVSWMSRIGAAPTYTIAPVWISRVAEVVRYAENAGLVAIINLHHDGADSDYWLSVRGSPSSQNALEGTLKQNVTDQYTAVWRQIATYFKDYGSFLVFEGFNELHDGNWGYTNSSTHNGVTVTTTAAHLTMQRTRVNELNQIFVNTVRATGGENANRFLVVQALVTRPSETSANTFVLPTDTAHNKLIVGFHFYDPYEFTGSASWSAWDNTWGNRANVRTQFNPVRDRFTKNGIPAIIGEYGAVKQSNTSTAAGEVQRRYYMEFVTRYAIECGFIPFYWDNGATSAGSEGFGLFNRSTNAVDTVSQLVIDRIMKAVNENYDSGTIVP